MSLEKKTTSSKPLKKLLKKKKKQIQSKKAFVQSLNMTTHKLLQKDSLKRLSFELKKSRKRIPKVKLEKKPKPAKLKKPTKKELAKLMEVQKLDTTKYLVVPVLQHPPRPPISPLRMKTPVEEEKDHRYKGTDLQVRPMKMETLKTRRG